MAGVNLSAIYNRLANAPKYHPMSANTFADWTMEAGDIVTVSRDGTGYSSPVGTMTMKWNGKQQVQISSEGSREREPISRTAAREFARGGGGSGGISQNHYWHQFVTDQYNQLQSGIELTGSTASLYVDNKYAQMRAGLDLTSSSASLYVDNRYKQMKAGLDLTSSSASLYVDNRYKQMKAGLDLTSSSASLYVDNRYKQMKAGLDLTSSSASLYVDNRYKQMKAGLDLTSSSAALYVDDRYRAMRAGVEATSSSATLYAKNRTTRAYIMARINANGESEDLISADKVSISGRTTINDVVTIIDGAAVFHRQVMVTAGSGTISLNGGKVSATTLQGGSLVITQTNPSGGMDSVTMSKSDLANCIISATVSGNTLTLTNKNGDTVNFSKATTLNGQWNGGVLTITASPQNVSKTVGLGTSGDFVLTTSHGTASVFKNEQGTENKNYISLPTYIQSVESSGNVTRFTTTPAISVSSLRETKTITENGTYTPGDGKLGFSTVTVNVPSGSSDASDISIDSSEWRDSSDQQRHYDATLSNTGSLISKGKLGYIYFRATISGGTGEKWYRIPIDTR